jgi:hypothetical protein
MEALMKTWKHTFLIAVVALTILSLLLSACGPIDNSDAKSNNGKDKDNGNDKGKDKEKDNDTAANADKVTICHRTGSAKNPYVKITISVNATTDGHGTHEGDLIPAPEGGCPDVVISSDVLPK